MTTPHFEIRPSIIKGDPADTYLHWTKEIMRLESLNPRVLIDFFAEKDGVLCGIEEAKALLVNVLPKIEQDNNEVIVSDVEIWCLEEGQSFRAGEPVLRIIANYASVVLYETSLCGMLASSSGWATAARECVEMAGNATVITQAARHIHPNVAHILDYASVIGGCSSVSTVLGSKQSGRNTFGNMPHSLPLIFGDTVSAAVAFDKHMGREIQRIVVVDTFQDEAQDSLNVANVLRDKLRGIRLDTPIERGGVTPAMVLEVRSRLDLMNFRHVEIYVSGEITPAKIKEFEAAGAPINGYLVGDYISSAAPVNFTANILEIENKPVARRGRVPGRLDGPRLGRFL
jgi:nicotinate phosphoribosyltransferase